MAPKVFVTGATGTQGGVVTKRLLAAGWSVRTTVRDPSKPAAQALSSQGVELVTGDWDNEVALEQGMAGCDKLFLNLFPTIDDLSREHGQAQKMLRIAGRTGTIKQVVYTTMFPTTEKVHTKIPMHDIKADIEREVEACRTEYGIPHWTIMHVGWFMLNFLKPGVLLFREASQKGVFHLPMARDTLLPLFDHEEVGTFVEAAFQEPGRFDQQRLVLASELMSVDQVIQRLAKASGKPIRANYLTHEEAEALDDWYVSHLEALVPGMASVVDMEKVESWGLPLGSFDAFLEREKERVVATYAEVPS